MNFPKIFFVNRAPVFVTSTRR